MAKKTTKERLTSRKFILSVILYLAMTAFVFTGDLDVDQYWQYALIILGIYTGGNVVDHISADYREKEELKSKMDYEAKMEEVRYMRNEGGSASSWQPRREMLTDSPRDETPRSPRPPSIEDNERYKRRG